MNKLISRAKRLFMTYGQRKIEEGMLIGYTVGYQSATNEMLMTIRKFSGIKNDLRNP